MFGLQSETELDLTVVLTVVSGKNAVRENLKALVPQIDFARAEVIVPFDRWACDVGDLSAEFSDVRFHYIEDLGVAESPNVSSHQHRLFDRRRAIGLRLARGRIVAITEDHALPAGDWVLNIFAVHTQPYGVIGGAIQNGVDRPMNRALYFCDFGRYGLPFEPGERPYVSDVNISYKREALNAVRSVWFESYCEIDVHAALYSLGRKLFLDDRPIVYQHRPPTKLWAALAERTAWGRIFAEARAKRLARRHRIVFAVGTPVLPFIMIARALRHMRRQRLAPTKVFSTVPLAFAFLCTWSIGEFLGYSTRGLKAISDVGTAVSSEPCS